MTDSVDLSARVLFLCRVLWNGGVQRVTIAEVEGLRELGQPTDLLFLRRVDDSVYQLPSGTRLWEGPPTPPAVADLEQAVTRWFAPHRGQAASVDLFRLWTSRRELSRYRGVVYNDQYAGLIGAWNRIRRGRPYLLVFHEFYPRVPRGFLSRLSAPVADMLDIVSILLAPVILTTSTAVKARIDRFVPGRARLARIGVTVSGNPMIAAPANRRHVYSITVWDRGRHPETYLEIAQKLPDFAFTMAGMWADPAHLAEFRERAASVPNLRVTGVISEEERERLQRGALFYLRLGFNESGPGVGGLEALGTGAILICNRGLGISEIVTNNLNGFVLDTAESSEAASLFRRLDAMSLEELGRVAAAGQRLAKSLSWEGHCRIVLKAIEDLAPTQIRARVPGSQPEAG